MEQKQKTVFSHFEQTDALIVKAQGAFTEYVEQCAAANSRYPIIKKFKKYIVKHII